MRRLLVDAGNTRVKWAVAGEGAMRALEHHGDAAAAVDAMFDDVTAVDEAVLVDVTGAFGTALEGRVATRILRSSAQACGIHNGYSDPSTLGADRWAALIGARTSVTGSCCIIDAGTALTFDALAADGRHIGGLIAPGLSLARAALMGGTRGVRPHADNPAPAGAGLGVTTADAVTAGAMLSALGFIDRACRLAAAAIGCESVLIVTGGDASLVAAAFPDALRIDDLVLRGATAWADA